MLKDVAEGTNGRASNKVLALLALLLLLFCRQRRQAETGKSLEDKMNKDDEAGSRSPPHSEVRRPALPPRSAHASPLPRVEGCRFYTRPRTAPRRSRH